MRLQQEKRARFKFGKNWKRFLKILDDERIVHAQNSLKEMLEMQDLNGIRFLDAGSGSGLFSLAARNLGATVYSFDYDYDSVACTEELKRRYWPDDDNWQIKQGDVLEFDYLESLGRFDVVYSWGVLHHTGNMWKALDNISKLINNAGGKLFIAIYNDQRWLSSYWKKIKRIYNSGTIASALIIATHSPYFLFRITAQLVLTGNARISRGMDPWRDIIDWLGGYPFEVARPEEILDFMRDRNFIMNKMTTVDCRHGCNQFVLKSAKP